MRKKYSIRVNKYNIVSLRLVMEIVRHSTIVYCKDIKKSRKFYETILGFKVDQDFIDVVFYEEGVAVWEIKETHSLSKMLGKGFFESGGKPFELYFEINDWDTFTNEMEEQDIEYLQVPHMEPWGQRTVRFLDPDLNIVEVGEPLEVFIRRLYEDGKSKEEIAEMNGLSIEEVERILTVLHARK
jgi:catechol 2,3-dioxygenase-like lactoylglutathione lyase family enzyme